MNFKTYIYVYLQFHLSFYTSDVEILIKHKKMDAADEIIGCHCNRLHDAFFERPVF